MYYVLFKDASRACGMIAALHHDSLGSCIECSLQIRVETQPVPPKTNACCSWLHLEQFDHSILMFQRCGQVNNLACILNLIFMNLYKAWLVPGFNHADHKHVCQAPLPQLAAAEL